MQQDITRLDVHDPRMPVQFGGTTVVADSVNLDRELPDPLMSGRLTAASGTVTATPGDDVSRYVPTPWDPATQWPPSPESAVTVAVDSGAGPVTLLGEGRVTAAHGGTDGRAVAVDVADAYETLERTISWNALSDRMPGPDETEYRENYVSLGAGSITDTIFRHCGWYCTPPRLPYSVLSVPLMGTTWPEAGSLTYSMGANTTGSYPTFARAPWGWAVANGVDARYTNPGTYTLRDRGTMEMTAMVNTSNVAGSSLAMDVYTTSGSARLDWDSQHVRVRIPNTSGSVTTIFSIPQSVGFAYASIRYVSASQVEVTLEHAGTVRTGTVSTTSGFTGASFREAHIRGDASGAGFQIAYPSTARTLAGWVPNAVLHAREGFYGNSLIVRPSVQGENCADLLRQQSEAECATYWIDELGVMHWWDLATLEARSPVAALTSDDDIEEAGFSWSHDMSQVKSRVAVKWTEPLGKLEGRPVADVWQGSGVLLQEGSLTTEGWITTPNDEVWIGVDMSLGRVQGRSADPDELFNYGVGSWYGGVIDDRDEYASSWGNLAMNFERVTDAAYKYLITWSPTHPSYRATLRTPSREASSYLWGRRRDMDLPIIRASARFELAEQLTYSSQTGPARAPEHVIDTGWWIQKAEQAEWTADYAAARFTVPQPVLSSVALIPVPGLQIGDVVTVQDKHVTRLTVRGLIIADSRSLGAGMGMQHTVTIRPLTVTRDGITWEEWGRVMASRTWTAWGTQQQPNTWQQWGNSPLAGEGQ